MKRLFRSRLPPPLTPEQLEHLTEKSHLPVEDIEEWYERFNHCYPRGYVSLNEFLQYLHQFQNSKNRETNGTTKTLVKNLFRLMDLNDDKHMNFDEFFLFNLLMHQGSPDEKLRLIFRLYDRDKEKYFTEQQLEDVLKKMFEVLVLPPPADGLSQAIHEIFLRTNMTQNNNKVSWNTFRTYVLGDKSLFRLLLSSSRIDERIRPDSPYIITTRF